MLFATCQVHLKILELHVLAVALAAGWMVQRIRPWYLADTVQLVKPSFATLTNRRDLGFIISRTFTSIGEVEVGICCGSKVKVPNHQHAHRGTSIIRVRPLVPCTDAPVSSIGCFPRVGQFSYKQGGKGYY